MKWIIRILVVVLSLSLATGFIMQYYNLEKSEVVIGISMLGIAFILIPLFLYIRMKGRDLTKYSFNHNPSPENLDDNVENENSQQKKE